MILVANYIIDGKTYQQTFEGDEERKLFNLARKSPLYKQSVKTVYDVILDPEEQEKLKEQ